MNAKDIIELMNYYHQKPSRKKRRYGDVDVVELLKKKQEETKILEAFLEDQRKANLEKQPKGHTFTFAEGMILAYVAQFVIGPLYTHYLTVLGIH